MDTLPVQRAPISRAGQFCYIQNKALLQKEGQFLDPDGCKRAKSRNVIRRRNTETMQRTESSAAPSGSLLQETKTQRLRRGLSQKNLAVRDDIARQPMTKTLPRSWAHLGITKKVQAPYWSRAYCGVKEGEFEAIKKKGTEKQQVSHEAEKAPSPVSRPRTSWLPRSTTDTTGLDFLAPAKPIIASKMVTFTRSERKSVLLEGPIAHESRFSFNPNEHDFFGATHYRPFPVTVFNKQLSRDDKAFAVQMTPASTSESNTGNKQAANHSPSSHDDHAGIPFAKMLSRQNSSGALASARSYSANTANLDKVAYDRLSNCKRTMSPRFAKCKPRYKEGQEMPAFMQNINTRTTLTTLCFEMLRANRYFGTEQQTSTMSSSPSRRPLNRRTKSLRSLDLRSASGSPKTTRRTMNTGDFTLKVNALAGEAI